MHRLFLDDNRQPFRRTPRTSQRVVVDFKSIAERRYKFRALLWRHRTLVVVVADSNISVADFLLTFTSCISHNDTMLQNLPQSTSQRHTMLPPNLLSLSVCPSLCLSALLSLLGGSYFLRSIFSPTFSHISFYNGISIKYI